MQPQTAGIAVAASAKPKPAVATPAKPTASTPAHAAADASTVVSPVADPVAAGLSAPAAAPTVAAASSPSTVASQHAPAIHQAAVVVSQLVTQGGSQRLVVQLHPLDLGRIEVSVERVAGGGTHVTLRAERPETQQALQRDQAEIGRALDRAGVPVERRTVTVAATGLTPTTPATPAVQAGNAAPQPQAMGLGLGLGQGSGSGSSNGWTQDQAQNQNQAQHRGSRSDATPWAAAATQSPARSGDTRVHPTIRSFDITA